MWTHIDSFHMGKFSTKLLMGEFKGVTLIKVELWLGSEMVSCETWVKNKKKLLLFRVRSLQLLNKFLDKHKAIVKETKEKYFGDFDWKEVEM